MCKLHLCEYSYHVCTIAAAVQQHQASRGRGGGGGGGSDEMVGVRGMQPMHQMSAITLPKFFGGGGTF